MAYTGSLEDEAELRRALKYALSREKGERRSAMAILRSVNSFVSEQNRVNEKIEHMESHEKRLRGFANGEKWPSGLRVKKLLWELFISENIMGKEKIDLASSEFDVFARFFNITDASFLPNLPKLNSIEGKFLIYKRAISNPETLIVRGLIEFSAIGTESRGLQVKEIHINRTHRNKSKEASLEFWTGYIFPREFSFNMITKETKRGTPKMAVLEIAEYRDNDNLVDQMKGFSVECIEAWSNGRTFQSGIFLERIYEDFDYFTDRRLDLVQSRQIKKEQEYVFTFLGKL
ncbi:MAG: hypothetical protein K2X47_06065 [Bdellovibrionales bacterium]|nr:hypothetical protein [Bdellovibrionales bacterium]